MANQLYPKGRQKFIEGSFDLLTDTIKLAMITSSYAVNFTTDEFYSTPAANVVGTPGALASKTDTSPNAGTFDAADVTFTAVSGSTVSILLLYKDTGTNSTSPLIAYIDTGTGLPVTPNGGDITVSWDNGTNRIFTL